MDDLPRPNRLSRALEDGLFASRWLLMPIYICLAATLLLLIATFALKAYKLCAGIMDATSDDVIVGILSLIDLSLMANLVLIIIWAGYENFVSSARETAHPDRPDRWIAARSICWRISCTSTPRPIGISAGALAFSWPFSCRRCCSP
jgi:uncharacterized protein (TIGR00645 family)